MRGEAFVLAAAMALPTVSAWVYFVALSPTVSPEARTNPALLAAYTASKIVQFALPAVWMWYTEPAALQPGRLHGRGNGIGIGVGFGLAVAALAFGLYFGLLANSVVFRDVPERIRSKLSQFGLATPAGFVILAAFIAVAHAALEEYYWRWFVFGRLRHFVPGGTAAVVAALAFAGHHVVVLNVYFAAHFWVAVVPFSLGIAVGGVVWAWLYHRTRSLVGPWISHVIVDVAIMAIAYDLVFRATRG